MRESCLAARPSAAVGAPLVVVLGQPDEHLPVGRPAVQPGRQQRVGEQPAGLHLLGQDGPDYDVLIWEGERPGGPDDRVGLQVPVHRLDEGRSPSLPFPPRASRRRSANTLRPPRRSYVFTSPHAGRYASLGGRGPPGTALSSSCTSRAPAWHMLANTTTSAFCLPPENSSASIRSTSLTGRPFRMPFPSFARA